MLTPPRTIRCWLIASGLAALLLGQGSAVSPLLAANKAPQPYALIFGTVWGPDNVPLFGVKVKIRRAQEKKSRWELHSDHRGEFAQRVPPGPADYIVSPDLKGFRAPDGQTLSGEEVKVHIDNDERTDIGLHLK